MRQTSCERQFRRPSAGLYRTRVRSRRDKLSHYVLMPQVGRRIYPMSFVNFFSPAGTASKHRAIFYAFSMMDFTIRSYIAWDRDC